MIVTKVQPLDKKRSRIWLDGEFAFVLYRGELRSYKVEEGKELNKEVYDEIMGTILPKRAKLRAMNLLKSRTYSVAQLRNKLSEGEYSESIIDEALEYVASYGYTDDRRLCEEYVRIHINDKSRMRIMQDLVRKGISKDLIAEAFEKCAEYGFEQNEEQMAITLLRKRGYNPDKEYEDSESRMKEYSKYYAYLARKGFSSAVIRSVMKGFEMFD